MKEQVQTQVPQESMEDGITQGKTKGEGIKNLIFNVIIVTNMVIFLMNVEFPLISLKDKLTMLKRKIKKNPLFCWHIKEKAKRETHGILTLEQAIICVVLKTCLWSLMNKKVVILLLEMHIKF